MCHPSPENSHNEFESLVGCLPLATSLLLLLNERKVGCSRGALNSQSTDSMTLASRTFALGVEVSRTSTPSAAPAASRRSAAVAPSAPETHSTRGARTDSSPPQKLN